MYHPWVHNLTGSLSSAPPHNFFCSWWHHTVFASVISWGLQRNLGCTFPNDLLWFLFRSLCLTYGAKLQLLSMTHLIHQRSCHPNQYSMEDSYTLSSSISNLRCSLIWAILQLRFPLPRLLYIKLIAKATHRMHRKPGYHFIINHSVLLVPYHLQIRIHHALFNRLPGWSPSLQLRSQWSHLRPRDR